MLVAIGIWIAVATVIVSAFAADAHEFWIDASGPVIPGDEMTAELRIGEMLEGEPYPYLSKRFTRFTITADGHTSPIDGLDGDLPAVSGLTANPGLHVLAHQTVPFLITYDDWNVFKEYLAYEGLERFAAVHRTRGLPATGFDERYTRYAKAIVQSGPVRASDHDVQTGMVFELVAETNPYTSDLVELPVRLYWRGRSVSGWQINVFYGGETVRKRSVRTDTDGRAIIELGAGEHLLNAVMMTAVEDSPVVWQSHWASLSFELPDPEKYDSPQ